MKSLIDIVRADVMAFLESNNELLFNERDFQMHFATWLRNSANAYDDVDVEYYVPKTELDNYIWDSELRLDIVVKKGGEYCPVELKYKTKKVERQISRFDEAMHDKVVVMKNQGAQDLGMYDFWKDVRRVELVRNRFERVKGGLAVFVTNARFTPKRAERIQTTSCSIWTRANIRLLSIGKIPKVLAPRHTPISRLKRSMVSSGIRELLIM